MFGSTAKAFCVVIHPTEKPQVLKLPEDRAAWHDFVRGHVFEKYPSHGFGLVEPLRVAEDVTMWGDEEGRCNNSPRNFRAGQILPEDLVGSFVVMGSKPDAEGMPEHDGLTMQRALTVCLTLDGLDRPTTVEDGNPPKVTVTSFDSMDEMLKAMGLE